MNTFMEWIRGAIGPSERAVALQTLRWGLWAALAVFSLCVLPLGRDGLVMGFCYGGVAGIFGAQAGAMAGLLETRRG